MSNDKTLKCSTELVKSSFLKSNFDQIMPYIILVVLIVMIGIFEPSVVGSSWFGNKADGTMTLILAASAQAFVMLIQGMDLSIAGIICVVNSISALYMPDSVLGIIGMVLCMALLGMGAGALNGIIVVKFKLQSFIVTLATWSVWKGVALLILPIDGGSPPAGYVDTLLARVGGTVPVSVFLIAILCIFWYYLRRTRFGVSIFAVGNNEVSAYYSGIKVKRVKITAFVLSGLFAAFAGLFRTASVASGSPTAGESFLLLSFCAAVIGGVNVSGGRGNLYGVVAGAFILQIIADLLVFAGVSTYWTPMVQGLVLIAAVAFSSLSNMAKEKRRMEV